MDYIERQAREAPDEFTRGMYAELQQRLERIERGDPEFRIERMHLADLRVPGAVMIAIVAYFLVVVGMPS